MFELPAEVLVCRVYFFCFVEQCLVLFELLDFVCVCDLLALLIVFGFEFCALL